MASPTQWTWVWVSSGSWWWTVRPDMLQSMELQRVGHDWATELNWTEQLTKDLPSCVPEKALATSLSVQPLHVLMCWSSQLYVIVFSLAGSKALGLGPMSQRSINQNVGVHIHTSTLFSTGWLQKEEKITTGDHLVKRTLTQEKLWNIWNKSLDNSIRVCYLLAVWPRACDLISQYLNFLIYKMGHSSYLLLRNKSLQNLIP